MLHCLKIDSKRNDPSDNKSEHTNEIIDMPRVTYTDGVIRIHKSDSL